MTAQCRRLIWPPSQWPAVVAGSPSHWVSPRINQALLWLEEVQRPPLSICVLIHVQAHSITSGISGQIWAVYHRPLLVSLHFYSVDVASISPCISTHHIWSHRPPPPPPVLVMAIWYFPAATMKHLPFRFQQKAAPVTGWSNSCLRLTAVHLFTRFTVNNTRKYQCVSCDDDDKGLQTAHYCKYYMMLLYRPDARNELLREKVWTSG